MDPAIKEYGEPSALSVVTGSGFVNFYNPNGRKPETQRNQGSKSLIYKAKPGEEVEMDKGMAKEETG